MLEHPSSAATRKAVLRCLLLDGHQSAKVLVDQAQLGQPEEHGFPASVLSTYPDGVPLDLNPRWPMEIDLDSDADALLVSLAFEGQSHRCRIPWRAIRVVGVGFGGIDWEHDRSEVEAVNGEADTSREARGSHLRIVK